MYWGTEMQKSGFVKWFNPGLGYGFIQSEDGEDIFLRYSDVQEEEDLDVGDEVAFGVEEGPNGQMAANVVKSG